MQTNDSQTLESNGSTTEWLSEAESLTVHRTACGDIDTITVTAVRTRQAHNHYSRIVYELDFGVDDGRAELKTAKSGDSNALSGVHIHHLVAVLNCAERAVGAIPDVDTVECLEDAIERRRIGEADQ